MKTIAKQDLKFEYHEELDQFFTKERLASINWVRILGLLAIVLSIAQIVLSIIHLVSYSPSLIIILLISSIAFFIGGILALTWAHQARHRYEVRHELFQPATSETLTQVLFIIGVLLAGVAVILFVNLYIQSEYTPDHFLAESSIPSLWEDKHGGKTVAKLSTLARDHFIAQSFILGYHFFFFLLAARTAFRCLKVDAPAMSSLIFVGNVIMLGAALGVIYYVELAFGYEEYVQLRANFPVWNIRGLQYAGVTLAVVSVIGFLVNHKSWRVGFFTLAILLLFLIIALVNFSGFAYRHTRQTYNYYKDTTPIDVTSETGTNVDASTCLVRMHLVHYEEIEGYGCPQKYIDITNCPISQRHTIWETLPASNANDPNAYHNDRPYCLNTACCGLLGELYSQHELRLSNFSLAAIFGVWLVSIGCYYFWYVTWVDSNRNKNRDYIWLVIMALTLIGWAIFMFVYNPEYINEKVGPNGERYL